MWRPQNVVIGKLIAFRIIQEQVQNIIKHSGATQACIAIHKKRKILDINIEDNGKGFDLANTKKGLGLTNIINRAEYYGGNAVINTRPGKGCKFSVSLPI
jgi:two-component system sensor histidine kinase UhpB